jgi:hypothetical protein
VSGFIGKPGFSVPHIPLSTENPEYRPQQASEIPFLSPESRRRTQGQATSRPGDPSPQRLAAVDLELVPKPSIWLGDSYASDSRIGPDARADRSFARFCSSAIRALLQPRPNPGLRAHRPAEGARLMVTRSHNGCPGYTARLMLGVGSRSQRTQSRSR